MKIRRFRMAAAGAVLMAAPLLAACVDDTIVDSLQPSAADRAQTPEPPAGTVAALVRLGDDMRRHGDPRGAIAFYRRAHARDRFNAPALIGLGEALDDIGAYNDAGEAFREALVAAPVNADAMRGLGNSLLPLNQPALAIDQFQAALRIAPDPRLWNGIGVARDRMGDHKGAQEAYREGLKLAPDNLALLNNLGLSLAAAGDDAEAVATLEKAAQAPGAGARQRQNLAMAYALAGRRDDAARLAQVDMAPAAAAENLDRYETLRDLRGKGVDPSRDLDMAVGQYAVTE